MAKKTPAAEQPAPGEAGQEITPIGVQGMPHLNPIGAHTFGGRWVMSLALQGYDASPQLREVTIAVLSLSWPLAKAIHGVMGKMIEDYEAKEGPIAMPKTSRPEKKKLASLKTQPKRG